MGEPEWVPMSKAAREVGVSISKLSRLVSDGRLKSDKDPRDERVVLVDMVEVKEMFPPRRRK